MYWICIDQYKKKKKIVKPLRAHVQEIKSPQIHVLVLRTWLLQSLGHINLYIVHI